MPIQLSFYRDLFSRSKGSLYKDILISLRNTKGFHVDAAHFEEWLGSVGAPEITVWQRDGDSPLDWGFTMSMQIQSFYGKKAPGDYDTVAALGHAPHLVFVVEALCAGLMVDAGYGYDAGWRPSAWMVVRIEYDFRDGRLAFCEQRRAAVEGPEELTGSAIHELKQYFAVQFGVLSEPKRVGWIIHPGDGSMMLFRCQRGTARVFPGPWSAKDQSVEDEALMLLRLRDAPSYGQLQADGALKLIEAVGHKRIEMTLGIYAHVLPSMQQDAARRLGALLHG